jgi:SAM-dependent methyltransferase
VVGVLDAGAGTGRHSLLLNRRGLAVTSVDLAPINVAIMRRLGVPSPLCADVFRLPPNDYDTILMLNRGLGMCQRLDRFEQMLHQLATLLAPGGCVLADSTEMAVARRSGSYPGDIRLRIRYMGQVSGWFEWLYVDAITMSDRSARAGWHAQVVHREGADFLAVLTPEKGSHDGH